MTTTKNHKRQQGIRLQHTILAAAGGGMLSLIAVYGYYAGYFLPSKTTLQLSLTFFWLVSLLFIAVIASGINKNFKDPSLTLPQMYWAASTSFALYACLSQLHTLIYLLVFLIMIFGAFRLTVKQFRVFSVFSVAAAILSLSIRELLDLRDKNIDDIVGIGVFIFSIFTLSKLCESLSILRDRLREKNAQLKDAMGAKDSFLANMSHEIRTPINGVIGMLDALQRTTLTAQQSQYAKIAESSADMLLAIVNDILDLSKIQAGKMVIEQIEFDFHKEMDTLINDFAFRAEQKGLLLLLDFDTSIPRFLNGDPVRVKQILSNLLSNAIKFTQQGNIRVRISTDALVGDQLVLRFEVIDTGIGIAEDKIQSLFNTFTQVDDSTTRIFGGTGLGLAICRQLCFFMGGDIELQSQQGKGSQFSFRIPFPIETTEINSTTPYTAIRNTNPKLDIFLIDPLTQRNQHTQEVLRALNYTVCSSTNEAEFLTHIETQQTLEGSTSLVLASEEVFEDGIKTLKNTLKLEAFNAVWVRVGSLFQRPSNAKILADGFDNYLNYPIKAYSLCGELTYVLANKLRENETISNGNEPLIPDAHATYPHPTEANTKTGSNPNLSGLHKKHVLVAEDNKINQQVALLTLNALGFEVDIVNNGAEALDTVTHQTQPYDLILMDCQMPIMDGFEATREIRLLEKNRSLKATPIVAMTANAQPEDVTKCLQCGMNDHIAKPIITSVVNTVLNRVLQADSEATTANDDLLSPTNTTSAADDWHFEDLKNRLGNKEQRCKSLIALFLEHGQSTLPKLKQALAEKDHAQIKKLSHSLRGSSANMGAQRLSKLLLKLESEINQLNGEGEARRHADVDLEKYYKDVEYEWQHLDTLMRPHVTSA